MAKLFERDLTGYNKTTGEGLGRREDIADMITLVDAKDTPVQAMLRKASQPNNTLFQWQVDSNPDPLVRPVIDGTDEDVNGDTANGAKMENYTEGFRATLAAYPQIFRRKFGVSKLTNTNYVKVAGTPSEMARQMSKAMLAIKRDIEVTLTSSQGNQEDTGSEAYRFRALDKWTKTKWEKDTVLPVADKFCTPADNIIAASENKTISGTSRKVANANVCASPDELNESHCQDMLQALYEQTGQIKTYDLVLGTNLKRAFSRLVYTTPEGEAQSASPIRTMRNAGEATYIQNIQQFKGDFGTLNLHVSNWLGDINTDSESPTYGAFTPNRNKGFVIPFEYAELRYGGNVAEVIELTDNGGGPRRAIEMVLGLCIHNPLAFGKFDFAA